MKTISGTRLNRFASDRRDELKNISSLLDEIGLFKGLEPAEWALFLDKAEVQTYPARSMIFTPEDSSCERLYILRQGRVNLYRLTASGKRLVTRQILPGSLFGVRALLGRVMQRNFAEAVENSTICIITREQVLALLKRRPELALQIMEMVCKRLYLLEERLVETVYSPVSVRLAYFLLTNADSATGLLTNITHEEIGDTIGAVRQTVTETLSLMRKQGLISAKPKQIRIIDRQGLEGVIKGSDN
jgi:CRP/FNR family cyclic AMP-dependent transcriptional regulator